MRRPFLRLWRPIQSPRRMSCRGQARGWSSIELFREPLELSLVDRVLEVVAYSTTLQSRSKRAETLCR